MLEQVRRENMNVTRVGSGAERERTGSRAAPVCVLELRLEHL